MAVPVRSRLRVRNRPSTSSTACSLLYEISLVSTVPQFAGRTATRPSLCTDRKPRVAWFRRESDHEHGPFETGRSCIEESDRRSGLRIRAGDDAVQESSRCQHRNRVGDRPESARETKRGVCKIGSPFSFCLEQGMKACPTTGNR